MSEINNDEIIIKKKPSYNPKYLHIYLKYQAKLRAKGLYKTARNTPESYQRFRTVQYENDAIRCIKKLFGISRLI